MNKKWLIAITVLLVGFILCTTAFAFTSGSNGYDVYKTALKNTWVAQSLTGTVGISVTDNGYPMLNSRDMVKMNLGSRDMSGCFIVSAGGQDCVIDMYRQDGRVITRMGDSTVQSGIQGGNNKYQDEYRFCKEYTEDIENIIDLLTYKLHDYIILYENPDGTRDVSLKANSCQMVPPVCNAVLSLIVKSGVAEQGNGPIANLVESNLPKLVDNIEISGIGLQAKVSADNLIEQQTANISVIGTDASGNKHDIMIGIDLNLSEFNSTVPDTYVSIDAEQ